MTTPAPALSIVMPCYNRAHQLGRVLEAYERQEGGEPFELLAVDDGSTDATPELLSAHRGRRFELRPLLLGKNAGPANARNQGIAAARAPLVAFVGDDILPGPDFVSGHLSAHAAHPGEGWAILGKTVWPEDLPQNTLMQHVDGVGAQQFSYFHLRPGQVMDFRHFYTSNISLKASLFRSVKPWFDTGFPHAAYEDVELGYRLERDGGMRIVYAGAPLAHHYHYYTVWSFSERQYRCGEMSSIFVRKHPHLRRRWRFDRVETCAALARIPEIRERVLGEPGEELDEVETLGLHLASHYELTPAPPLDELYLLLLESFVVKGMIAGELPPDQARPARRVLLLAGVLPHLASLAGRLEDAGVPRPEPVCLSLLALARRHGAPPRGVRARQLFEEVRGMIVPRYY